MVKKIVIVLIGIIFSSGCTGRTGAELYTEGVKLLREGNANGAIVLFRNALEKEQNNFDARYQLARAYVSVGKYELAEKEFQKVKRLNPAHPDIQLELAKLYNTLMKPDLAISQGEEYLASKPDSTDALETIGVAYGLKGMPQIAETYFERALQKNPGKVTTRLEMASLRLRQGKAGEAKYLLEEVIKVNPRNARAYYLLGDAEIALGRKGAAFEIYKKVAEINPGDPTAPYKYGILGLEMGDRELAEATAAELIRKYPRNGEGYRLKGMVSYRKKDFLEAIAAFQNANKLQPTVAGYYFMGLSLLGRGELENALSQFRQILDRAPAFQQARLLTGMILLRQNRTDDAISELTKLLEAEGNNSMAHNLLGSAYIAKGMYEEGMKELDTAIRIDPKLVNVYLKKGMIHLRQGRSADAETDLATAIRVSPEHLNTRFLLSSFYLHRSSPAKALATLKEGIAGNKNDGMLYAGMAKIMFSDRKPVEAIRYLQMAKESNPAFVDPYFILAAYYAVSRDIVKAANEYSALLQKEPGNVKAMLRMAALMEADGRDSEALGWYLRAVQTRDPLAYMATARYYEKIGDNGKAFSILDEARKNVPRSIALLEQKGALHLKLKQYKNALKTYDDIEALEPERGIPLKVSTYAAMNNLSEAMKQARRTINLKPDSPLGYMLLATVYLKQNKPDSAIEEMKKAKVRDDKNPRTALTLAGLYATTGNHALALGTCENILKKHPDFAPAYYAQGTFLEADNKKKEAVGKYRAALAISGNYTAALNNLAYLCAEGYGSRDEALRLAESAILLEPGNPGLMDTLGYAQLKSGRYQEALKNLEKAEKLLPGNPTINYHIALVHQASGDRNQAVARLQIALRSEKFQEMNQARNLLAKLN